MAALIARDRAQRLEASGKSGASEREQSSADFDAAVRCDPHLHEAWVEHAEMRFHWAIAESRAGMDGTPHLAAAVEGLARARLVLPGHFDLNVTRASLWLTWGNRVLASSGDPTPQLDAAEADLRLALAVRPDLGKIHRLAGMIRLARADHRSRLDGDVRAEMRGAVGCFEQAVAIAPEDASHRLLLAETRQRLSVELLRNGEDPRVEVTRAIADYDEVLRRAPDQARPLANRGAMKAALGLWRDAAADLDAAERIDPSALRDLGDVVGEVRRRTSGEKNK